MPRFFDLFFLNKSHVWLHDLCEHGYRTVCQRRSLYWLLWICPTYQSRPIILVVYEKALIGALGTLTFSTSKFECCKSLDCISDDTTVMAGATFEDLFVCGNVTRWLSWLECARWSEGRGGCGRACTSYNRGPACTSMSSQLSHGHLLQLFIWNG